MQERSSSSGLSSVPLGHKFLAILFAIAVAFGAHTWLGRNAARTAGAAELSFDSKTARHIDPGIGDAAQPAVAAAQSILTDQVIAGLSKSAYLASSGMTTRIGEFRSRLEFTQPQPKVLDVSFRDADPARAIDTANTIAKTLANWSPSFSAPAATSTPAPSPAPPAIAPKRTVAPAAPIKKAAPPRQEESGLAAALTQLEDQLSSTDRQLDSSRESRTGHGAGAWDLPSYSQSRQQQLLKSRVRESEQQLRDLRAKYPAERRLGSIQQELSSVLPKQIVGVSSARLREERAQLVRTISTVESVRLAVQHEEAAHPPASSGSPPSSDDTQPASQSIAESNLGQSSAPQTQPPPAPAAPASEPLTAQSEPGPLSIVRYAGSAVPVPWWPSAVAGAVCGLLYFSIVAVRYRRSAAAYDYEEAPAVHGTRFITPDAPVAAHEHDGEYARLVPQDPPAHRASFSWEPAAQEQRENPSRRASFSYDPGPHQPSESNGSDAAQAESAPPHAFTREAAHSDEPPAPSDPPAPVASAEVNHNPVNHPGEEVRPVVAHDSAPLSAAFPDFLSDRVSDPPPSTEEPAPLRGSGLLTDPPIDPGRDQSKAAEEKVVPMWDSWADNLKKSLSQTEIGRMFESGSEREPVSSEQRSVSPRRSTRDRMAG